MVGGGVAGGGAGAGASTRCRFGGGFELMPIDEKVGVDVSSFVAVKKERLILLKNGCQLV